MAEPGDNIGMNVRGIAKNDVHREICRSSSTNPPNSSKRIHRSNHNYLPPNSKSQQATPQYYTTTQDKSQSNSLN